MQSKRPSRACIRKQVPVFGLSAHGRVSCVVVVDEVDVGIAVEV
jgi:hypothetical protein